MGLESSGRPNAFCTIVLASEIDFPESTTACKTVVIGLITVEPAGAERTPWKDFPVIMSVPPKASSLPVPESADSVKLPLASVVVSTSSSLRMPSPSVSIPTEPPLM